MTDVISAFREAALEAGYELPDCIMPDGRLHRFDVADGKRGNKAGWYLLHADGKPNGVYGTWKQPGSKRTWKAPSTHSARFPATCSASSERARVEKERHADCRASCVTIWEAAAAATLEHSYLKRKGVHPYGLKTANEMLLVPVRDLAGALHGLQTIAQDGTKRFKPGTDKAGKFFMIGEIQDGTVAICEGYATGASIHEATGHTVVIAFDAGNLPSVAQVIRSEYKTIRIIVCADDDHHTEENPGVTKATEAAVAVDGLLAVPRFPPSRSEKDTDFNDLARISGLEAVRACIDAAKSIAIIATTPTTSGVAPPDLEEAATRLSKLSLVQYDRVRGEEAKFLGIRQKTLDDAVKDARKGGKGEDLPFESVELWPEEVVPAEVLSDIAATIRRFIICTPETATAAALWIAITWFIDVIEVAPLAIITAPEKRCGKTQLLSLLGRLVAKPLTASSITPSALFRTIDAWGPTLLIDEADAFMKDNEELRGLLNSGHTRDSAYVIRCIGENFTPTKFNTWGAKALAGIGHLADTLMDRAITLELRRKLPEETVDRIRHAEQNLFANLRSKLARFAEDAKEAVRRARPPLPPALNDRAQDNWEPLLAIAMTAGEEWLQRGTTAALELCGGEERSLTVGTELLSDIAELFEERGTDRISTADLIRALCSDDEKPWATYNRGQAISPRQVASRLKEYGITSRSIRIYNSTPKGYTVDQFQEAFSRYLPPPKEPQQAETMPQLVRTGDSGVADNVSVADISDTGFISHIINPTVAGTAPRCGTVAEVGTGNTSRLRDSCVVAGELEAPF
ncbi:hypothetical protein GMLC_22690 [Geomonas limicola]|uniref:Toprim domain-containing protein n=1 Tax=Geomonas limicola TaxID=2740186 RepID=A0A6V8N8G1_9BACT|nr:DUF3631 domain-containing protein [Geomonas limicola]GFO68690.1 hypothetical protein GMLC_22690 [Geomonas limicola]